jgi:hypothetical protein
MYEDAASRRYLRLRRFSKIQGRRQTKITLFTALHMDPICGGVDLFHVRK